MEMYFIWYWLISFLVCFVWALIMRYKDTGIITVGDVLLLGFILFITGFIVLPVLVCFILSFVMEWIGDKIVDFLNHNKIMQTVLFKKG